MTLILHSSLSKELSLILDNADDYNVIIQVGEDQNTKEFRAHSVILRARSPYFKSALSTNWITKKDNMITFSKPNITPTVFDMILKYIYTGELDLTKHSGEDILSLLVASDELLLEELFGYIQDYLIEKKSSWVHENLILVLHEVIKLVNCKKLQDYCFEYICENPLPFITSKYFLSLDKEVLINILKRDDLQVKEDVIWDCLIKWGIEQTPSLGRRNNDRTKWNNEDYEALKKTLNQFIPLIRFVMISRVDFFDKVQPYKAIIPNNIYKEIEEFYHEGILPSLPLRTGQVESNIIKPELANIIIVNWIDKKNSMLTRTSDDTLYKFKLIYRGSRDGINNISFKNKCKSRIASLVLIKVKNSNKIFGGYSSIGFNFSGTFSNLFRRLSGGYLVEDGYNFIFSFENSKDMQNMKIGRVINKSKAIFDCSGSGFNFGQGSLYMINDTLYLSNYSGNYEKILNSADTAYFIEEIETFTITN